MENLIVFEQVQKSFGENVVFEDLTLSVNKGEVLSVVGGSGTGKSVLLKLLIGLLPVSGGRILVEGREVTKMDEEELFSVRAKIAMMFQGAALFDSISVAENVAYPLRQRGGFSEEEIARLVSEKLALVDLDGVQERMPAELSGGMKKRVALARAIATQPEAILFDEPTAGLDPLNTRRICDLIRSFQKTLSMTAIVVTHDLPSAFMISDRVAMLHNRRILAVMPTVQFRAASQPEIHEFVTAMDAPKKEEA